MRCRSLLEELRELHKEYLGERIRKKLTVGVLNANF